MVEYFFICKLPAGALQFYLAAMVQALPVLRLKDWFWGLCLHYLLRNMGAILLAYQAELLVLTATAAAKQICRLSKLCFHNPWKPVPGLC